MSDAEATTDDEAGDETSRIRTKTPKGKEFLLNLLDKDRLSAQRSWRRQLHKVEALLADSAKSSDLQKERVYLESRMELFTAASERMEEAIESFEERRAVAEKYETLDLENSDVLKRVSERIRELKQQEEENMSLISKTSTRSKSSRSLRSSRASVSEKRTEMAAKVARLGTELKFADIEARKTATLRKYEDEMRKFKISKDLAVAEAEMDALVKEELEPKIDDQLPKEGSEGHLQRYLASQLESVTQHSTQDIDVHPTDNIKTDPTATSEIEATPRGTSPLRVAPSEDNHKNNPIEERQFSPLNPFSPAFVSNTRPQPARDTRDQQLHSTSDDKKPSSSGISSDDTLNKLVDLLSRRNAKNLPTPEPETFRGDLLHFPTWRKSFSTIVEGQTDDPSKRLYYLGRYTAGEAREAIRGLLTLEGTDAYSEAMKTLSTRYGNPFSVAEAYRRRIEEWPKIPPNDGMNLRRFSDFLLNCRTAMDEIKYLHVLDDPEENKKMVRKLPRYLIDRWSRDVDKRMTEEEDRSMSDKDYRARKHVPGYPPFKEFCKFLQREARIACNPVISSKLLREDNKREDWERAGKRERYDKGRSCLATDSEVVKRNSRNDGNEDKPNRQPCYLCKGPHSLEACKNFIKMPLSERKEFIRSRGLCLGCLKWGHIRRDCRRRMSCATCNGPHPTSIHDDAFIASGQFPKRVDPTEATSRCVEATDSKDYSDCVSHSLIVPVWVWHKDDPGERRLIYALLDDQSDACFVKDTVLDGLTVSGPEVQLRLSTVLAEEEVTCQKISGLFIQGLEESISIQLPSTYSRDSIPARRGQIPRPETAARWSHLKPIARNLMPYREDLEVGLLIGTNCSRAIKPLQVIPGKDDEPYAERTALGWGVIGVVNPTKSTADDSHCSCNRVVSLPVNASTSGRMCHFVLKTQVKEIINPSQVAKMFELDFLDTKKDEQPLSHQDRKFIEQVQEGIHQRRDGHYEMPLPLKQQKVQLPNNKELALSRLKKLRGRLKGDKVYHQHYQSFMRDVIENGHAERVPTEELSLQNGQIWYIPHHGVYHPQKPNKIRVVFDASAVFHGDALNRHLLQGPDLTNSLTGVLCRFRKENIAFMCDIEGMFHQVHVNEEHRNLLRFLWWEDNDIEKPVVEYRMTVHLFGAVSSPGCSNFALKTAAKDFADECGEEAAEFVKSDFYVDDGLKSVSTVRHAITLIDNTKKLCRKGGFNLHKFISNRKEVIESIPVEERATGIKDLDLSKDLLPIERALGVQWCIESDEFQFRVELKDKPLTRRGILSTVSSIYDPLGLVAPFLLRGKLILQDICKDGAQWDDPVPDQIRIRWIKWREELETLAQLKIPRCYKPAHLGEVKTIELHNFSDASTVGYGQCSYLRMIDIHDQIHCSLVMAKARVTPSKPITIPRLELTAALLSVKIGTLLKKELKYSAISEVFWTDSEAVRGYVSNDSRRFHTFVANRVQSIRDHTIPEQWRKVGTKENPADYASRGLSAQELIGSTRWWKGPNFLWEPLDAESSLEAIPDISESDPEVKKVVSLATKTQPFATLIDRLQVFSDWHRARRAVALCLRLRKKFRDNAIEARKRREGGATVIGPTEGELTEQRIENHLDPITVEELRLAEIEIIKAVQREAFPSELALLNRQKDPLLQEKLNGSRRRKSVKGLSSIRRLDPFLDCHGILRVGGRIQRAVIPYDEKHPKILPKKGHVTELVIRHHHTRNQHQGRGITHAGIRSSGMWIISGGSAVGHHIMKCVTCRKLRGTLLSQKMADLPDDRLEAAAPFTYSAVDYFGPFYIKEGRREVKRYGVLFTCLGSRAIHIETAAALTTDSFLNAYRRFVGRRGPVRQLRSDRGTNFVGARNELENALAEMDNDVMSKEMAKRGCDWINFKFNFPSASHMGGAWERQIRTVRSVLTPLLNSNGAQLDDESLRTLMIETEAIVNSRPLTTDGLECNEFPDVLTPNHLLTQKSQVVLPPPGVFQKADLYCRKRWRRVQHLANEFWQRWRQGYLQSLQSRQKWTKPQRNLQVGDLVILKDESEPRNKWQLARVSETYLGEDGHVRKVKVALADSSLDAKGKRAKPELSYLERPIHKLVLLMEGLEYEDQGIPIGEP